MKICLVDDEQNILDILQTYLEAKGHEVVCFSSSTRFLEEFELVTDFCAYLIDWKLPEVSGIELVKKVRAVNKIVPVFMLTSCSSQDEIISGIEAGADDYIVKPCNMKELYARLNNALVKYNNVNAESSELKVIDEGNLVMFKGRSVALTTREFSIFKALLVEEGIAVKRDILLTSLDQDSVMIKRNVDVHVFSLRKKLSDISLRVTTVRGVGYKLERSA
jgi:two-component system, OmpR family, phosphate regulon response regulator PhoB